MSQFYKKPGPTSQGQFYKKPAPTRQAQFYRSQMAVDIDAGEMEAVKCPTYIAAQCGSDGVA
jgi:hypothetical protein